MEKCPHCPVRDRDELCRAQITNHLRYCTLADPDDPAYSPAMVARLRGETVPFPPLTTQARNLAGAAARFAASGGQLAPDEEKARRAAICGACEHFADGRCRLCGCWLHYKQSMASEHCPDAPPRW